MPNMTERDVRLAAPLDRALEIVGQAASELDSTFVLTEGASDFRSGHIEAGGEAVLDVILMGESSGITVVRVDTRKRLGDRLAALLAMAAEVT
jgi:hypothetical protein